MIASRFLAFFVLLSVPFQQVYCHPAASSLDREDLKNVKQSCYFSLKRISTAELHDRVLSTDVSTTCSGNLKKMEALLGPTKANLFGASSRLDLGAARSGFYSKSEEDLKTLADKLICDRHESELVSRWSGSEFFHVKRKLIGGHMTQMCSFPDFTGHPHDHEVTAKPDDPNTRYVSKEEAKIFTLATGHHLHAGTPVCREHHQQILSIIDEYNSNEKDMEWKSEDTSTEAPASVAPLDLIKRALYSLADALGLTRYIPTKPFPEYAKDTQRKKADIGYKMYQSVLSGIAPGHENTLHTMIERRFHPRNWERYLEHDADEVVSIVAEQYLLAPNMRMRDFTLALLAGRFSYGALLRHIPALSHYKYQKARRIALSGKYYLIVDDRKLERYDAEGVIELIMFLTSPLVLVGLPYGERVVYTSSGQELRIPNTVRMMSQTEIVRQFSAMMIAQGKQNHLLSPSSIIRIIKALPATQQHSMTCVDSYLAKSYYSFQDMLKIVNRLHELTIIDKDGQAGWTNDVLEGQLYLRTDFKLHVKPESLIADHCLTFGLSDPQDPAFRKEETHEHLEQCPRCVRLTRTFTEFLKLIVDAIESASSDSVKQELKEMHYKVKSHQEIIERLKYHEVGDVGEFRSAFTQYERHRIINGMIDGQCLITGDFAQKWLPHWYMEEQKQYFAKAGRSWHGYHFLCRLEGQFVQHAYVHLLMHNVQDSVVVTNLLLHAITDLKKMGITKVFVRSDNAGVYHSAATLGTIPDIMEQTGMKIDSWSFSERQDGKSSADRMFAICKGTMTRYFETGKDVYSTHDMFEALTMGGTRAHLRGISIFEVTVIPPLEAEKNDWKLPGIQDMGHFQYETGSEGKVTMRYWKYHGIGPGDTVTDMKGNSGKLVISHSATPAPISDSFVKDELERLRNNKPCIFWNNDVGRNTVDEVFDSDDEPEEESSVSPPKKPSPSDVLHYCWCGSPFIRFQNLLNHLEWGDHKICPEKVTMTDLALDTFKKTIEDRKRTSSLLPLDDSIGMTADASVPLLTEGFALFKRARGGALPASSRSFVVKYYEEMKAKGINADPEEAMNKQNMAPSVPFEDRLTFDQIKSLYCRLSHKKGKSKRSTTDEPMDVDDQDGDYDENETCGFGEWEAECEQKPDPENDPFFVYYRFIQGNKATLFLSS